MPIQCPSCFTENLDSATQCIACGVTLQSTQQIDPLHLPRGTMLYGGQYRVEKTLGEGGFAITYQATNINTSELVVIKERWPQRSRKGKEVLWGIFAKDKNQEIQKFKDEAEVLKKCVHESIVRYRDCFEENSTCYIVMDFIDGESLFEYVQKKGTLSESVLRKYFLQLAEALREVHSKDILHRDIKPDNIMLSISQDKAILIDFGIARPFTENVSKSMTTVVSHGYAPLEQYGKRQKRSSNADIYSLCASMYYAITAKVPPSATDRMGTDPLEHPIKDLRLNISSELEEVILIGMAVDRKMRFQDAQHLIEYLHGKRIPRELLALRLQVRQAQGDIALLTKVVQPYERFLQQTANLEGLIDLAQILIHLDRVEEAKIKAQQALTLRQNDVIINGLLGLVACREREWQQAVQYLENATQLDSKVPWIQLNLAWALAKSGNWKRASSIVEEVLKQHTVLIPDHLFFAKGLKAWIAINQGDWQAAISTAIQATTQLKSLTSSYSQSLKYWIYPCRVLAVDNYFSGRKTQDLNRSLDDFLAHVPDSAFAQGYQGWQLILDDPKKKSILTVFKQASEAKYPPTWVFLDLAILYELNGEPENAIKVYEECLKSLEKSKPHQSNQNNSLVLFRLGTLLGSKSAWEKSLEQFRKIQQPSPDFEPELYHNQAWVLLNLLKEGKTYQNMDQASLYEEMKAAYTKAIDLYTRRGDLNLAQQLQQALK
jgi:serine/threonine protein kinase